MPATPISLSGMTAWRISEARRTAVRLRDESQARDDEVVRDGSVERHRGPGEVGELEETGRGAGEVPVEDTGEPVPHEADVVRREVVVGEHVGARYVEEPPRTGVVEALERVVQLAGPGRQLPELGVGRAARGRRRRSGRAGSRGSRARGRRTRAPAGPPAAPARGGAPAARAPPESRARSGRRIVSPIRTAPPTLPPASASPSSSRSRSAATNGRSGSSQSTSSRRSGGSQRSSSWSAPGRGSASTSRHTATRSRWVVPIGCSPSSQPSTAIAQPSSSRISRTSASPGDSPGSTLPPGKLPAAGDGGRRRTPGGEETAVAHDRGADDERRGVAHGASVVAAAGARGAFAVAPGTARVPRSSRGTPICRT